MNGNAQHHPGAIALAEAADPDATADPAVLEHLTECVVCRVRVSRLRHAGLGVLHPDGDTVARVLEASVRPPALARTFAGTPRGGTPRAGEIWRIGGDDALLVWVGRVEEGTADVVPVVLDTDLADESTLVLRASDTELGVDLAIVASVRATVDTRSFLGRVTVLRAGIEADLAEVKAAVRAGREPRGVAVGAPVLREDDQRLDYRQVLADVLSELSPSAWARRRPTGDGADDRILDLLRAHLPERHRGCAVAPLRLAVHHVGDAHTLAACARVSFLDSSLVVATLRGDTPGDLLGGDRFLLACSELSAAEPAAEAVAVVAGEPGLICVVVPARQLRRAYEPPGGGLHDPWTKTDTEPLGAVDAIAKYLDKQSSAWEVTEVATLDPDSLDLSALARAKAAAAVDEIARQGRKALTPAKRATWSEPPGDLPDRIATLIGSLLAGGSPADTVEALLRGEQP